MIIRLYKKALLFFVLIANIVIIMMLSSACKSSQSILSQYNYIAEYVDKYDGYVLTQVYNKAIQRASGEVIIYAKYNDGHHGEHELIGIRKGAFAATESSDIKVRYVVLPSSIVFIEEGAFDGIELFDPDNNDNMMFVGYPATENSLSSTSGFYETDNKYFLWLIHDGNMGDRDLSKFQNYNEYNNWYGELRGIAQNVYANRNDLTLILPETVASIHDTFSGSKNVEIYSKCRPGTAINGANADNIKFYYYSEDANENSDSLKWSYNDTVPMPRTYKLIFNTEGGSYVEPIEMKCGDLIDLDNERLMEPAKEHYIFDGWYLDDTLQSDFDFIMPGKDITLYAKWTPINYTITFKLNEGDFIESLLFNVETYEISEPIVPERKGYLGTWDLYSLRNDDGRFIAENITVYAKYELIDYTIIYAGLHGEYDIGEPTNDNPESYNIEDESIILLDAQKTGYEFVKWVDSAGREISEIPAGSYGDLILTATWEAITYDIVYEDTPININRTTYTVETETFELSAPEKVGYDFTGWTENDIVITEIVRGSCGDKTLKANWSVHEYSIIYAGLRGEYDIDEPTNDNPVSYNIEDETIILFDAQKTGYEFVKWIDNYGQEISEIPAGSYGDIILTAAWEAIMYNISYELNGGTNTDNPDSFTIESIDDGIVLQNPTRDSGNLISYKLNSDGNFTVKREAYAFIGWYDSFDFSGDVVSEISSEMLYNLDLYAKWEHLVVESSEVYVMSNDSIYFGAYPQSKVSDRTTIVRLGSFDETWNNYGYYINDTQSEFMYYKDVVLDGVKYRGIYFDMYRPSMCTYGGTASNSYQDDNGYYASTTYWFKYEPIEWKIIRSVNGQLTLLSKKLLDAQNYDHAPSGSYAYRFYQDSTIHAWLNIDFAESAFNKAQQELLCDEVLIPSVKEWNSYQDIISDSIEGTDYAKSQGLEIDVSLWLYTDDVYDINAPVVACDGYGSRFCLRTSCGVLPMISIKI